MKAADESLSSRDCHRSPLALQFLAAAVARAGEELVLHDPLLFAKENWVSNLEQTQEATSVDDIDVGGETKPPCIYPRLPGGLVLCIDDNQDALECERAFLETFGYTVLTASSGAKGLELASIRSVDVVILDYFMPRMNGQEVAMELRRLRPHSPIILLTEERGVPERTLNLVDAFVAKHRLASQLLSTIEHLHRCESGPAALV